MSSSNSPCAACKFLRRKCTQECVFAPYFPADDPIKFSNVHKVFGASNVAKLLNELDSVHREDAVRSLAYEADCRLKDPVYGCVGIISLLQQNLRGLQMNVELAKEELASLVGPSNMVLMLQDAYLQAQFHSSAAGASSSSNPRPMNPNNMAQMMGMMQMPGGPGPVPSAPEQLMIADSQQQQLQQQQQLSDHISLQQQQLSGQMVQQPQQQQLRSQMVMRDGPLSQQQHVIDTQHLAEEINARNQEQMLKNFRFEQHRQRRMQMQAQAQQQEQLMRFNQGFDQANAEFGQMRTQAGAMQQPILALGSGFGVGNAYQIQPIQPQEHQQPQHVQQQSDPQLALGNGFEVANAYQIQPPQEHQQPQNVQQQDHDLQLEPLLLLQQPQQSEPQELLFQEHLPLHPLGSINDDQERTTDLAHHPPNC